MKSMSFLPAACLFILFGHPAVAANTADADAKVVNLETACATGQNNCFDNLADLFTWIQGTRKPDSAAPLTVAIGNGAFVKQAGGTSLVCDGQDFTGYVRFEGAGASNSVIQIGESGNFSAFFSVSGCSGMEFAQLAFNTEANYGYVTWENGGASRWNDVEVHGKGGAWTEANCATTEGTHYWYSSKLTARQAFTSTNTYSARCDKTWLFGSEVTSIAQAGGDHIGNDAGYNMAVNAQRFLNGDANEPEVHLYGSNIRALSYATVTNPPHYLRGTVYAADGGKVHIHGTGVDSISESGQDIYVLTAGPGGFIHANESSYVTMTTGTVHRIKNSGGIIKAPYLWEQGDTAPAIISEDGADTFVDTGGSYPVMYIYHSGCALSGGPWIDMAGQCRP